MQVEHRFSAAAEHDWLSQRVRDHGDEICLLLCHYREPCIIFGLSQRPEATLQRRLDDAGVPWIRRRAGGGTVYAGPWLLGVSLVLPAHHPVHALEPVQAYRWYGELWRSTLQSLGCDSRLPDTETLRRSRDDAGVRGVDWACYGALGHGEPCTTGPVPRKLLGIAQIRSRHASTLVAGLNLQTADWGVLCRLLGRPPEQATRLAASNAALADCVAGGVPATPASLARHVEKVFLSALPRALDGEVPGGEPLA